MKQTARPPRWGVLLFFIIACLACAPTVSADEDEVESGDDAPALVQDGEGAQSEDDDDRDDQVAAASDSDDDDDDGKGKGKYIAIGGVSLAGIFAAWKWFNRGRRLHKSSQTINQRRKQKRRPKSGIDDIFGGDDSGGGGSDGGGD